ncbi:Exosome complex component rrp42 [Lithohypha guttulata]|uniref:Ribosomal RNA-processing protein 42 n=1 Tax=Lithohypha guttulata TaxID=1690604 RepID=A0AAN7YD48_9EURO|nr:Exosome complex component rrp42 [Lithohypha guttulata]
MPASSTTDLLSPAELAYLHSSLSSDPPIRPDARLATDFRPFSAETDVLPNTMGSAHVGFADGREAVVGVRAEVERTTSVPGSIVGGKPGQDVDMAGTEDEKNKTQGVSMGKGSWVSLSLTLPGLRDDDASLVFLEEMLREVLVAPASSTTSTEGSAAGSYPLPLLSMATHLALRNTRIPRLKSEGEEDPLADDDWEASVHLYTKSGKTRSLAGGVPPVTLLVMVAGDNVLFDPSGTELSVADGVFAVSITRLQAESSDEVRVLAVRMLETSARDTFRGVARNDGVNEWDIVPGVWRPKVGGVKRGTYMRVVKDVLGSVGKEVIGSLEAFVIQAG